MNEHKDPQKIAAAFAQIQALTDALSKDLTGDAYRSELETVKTELFADEDTLTVEELGDRIGYILYGASIFGLTALKRATDLSGKSLTEELAECGKLLDAWLENPGMK